MSIHVAGMGISEGLMTTCTPSKDNQVRTHLAERGKNRRFKVASVYMTVKLSCNMYILFNDYL